MCSLVCLQVGALRVDLLAAQELALVYPPLRVRTVVVLSLVMLRGHNWNELQIRIKKALNHTPH